MNRDELEGKAKELKGKMKQAGGDLVNNEELHDEGVADEAEAVRVAKQYLSYFQGSLREWQCADQRLLQIAVVIAARRPVTLFSPAHVKSIYITAGESSTATA